jgi:hypothetical protein
MKFSVTPNPKGAFAASSGRRVTISPAANGKDFADQAAFAAAYRLLDYTLYQARQTALGKAQADYEKTITKGITVNEITFAAQDSDRAAFTQLMTLLREAEEAQPDDAAKATFRASQYTVTDIDGAPHSLAVDQIRAAIIQYGNAINGLWASFAEKKASIMAATTPDQLAAIK